MKDFQKEVGIWGVETFNHKPFAVIKHLEKEVQELLDAEKRIDVIEECADVLLLTLHVAHLYGFDLMEAGKLKHDINKKRKWQAPDKDGVIEHVR